MAGTSIIAMNRKLGSAALTVAVLILFVTLVLALLLRVLTGLAGLTALLTLSGLAALLALPDLVTLLLHIVCHKKYSPKKAREFRAFEI
jgi:hypothetical protein